MRWKISPSTTIFSLSLPLMQYTLDKTRDTNYNFCKKRSPGNRTFLFLFLLTCSTALSQDLKLLDWKPKSQLVVHRTEITRPKFPVIDIHNHLGELQNMEAYLQQMDKAGVNIAVSLDGHSHNDFYKEHLKRSQALSKNRLLVFFAPDWQRIDEPNFGVNEAKR